MAIHQLVAAFNAGELSPLMDARVAVEKYQAGCRRLRNMICHVHGPVTKRPGMERRGAAASDATQSRLLGFNFSARTAFVVEMAVGKFRFWSNGVQVPTLADPLIPLEVVHTYTAAQIFEVQIAQVNDITWITHPDHPVRRLVRLGDQNWQLQEIDWQFPPVLDENVAATTMTCAATTGTDVILTASADTFQAAHVGSYWQIAHRRPTAFSELVGIGGTFVTLESTAVRILGRWELTTYGKWTGSLYLERKNAAGTWDVLRTWVAKNDRNIISTGEQDDEAELRLRVASGTAGTVVDDNPPRFILEAADAKIYGLVKVRTFTDATHVRVDIIRSLWSTDATVFWSEGAWSAVRGYPRAVALHEQRLCFGGTSHKPQTVWGSTVGDFENFRRTSFDDGSFSYEIASSRAQRIQWMVSKRGLIVGTDAGEWAMESSQTDSIVTPTNVRFRGQSENGSAYVQAVQVQDAVVHLQRNGRKLRQMAYSSGSESYGSTLLTVLAEHVTDSGVKQLAVQSQQDSILWAVTNDGRLLGMTFEKEQNVFAWHVHSTDGTIESVATIYGTEADEIWMTVLRGSKRSVERFHPATANRDFSDVALLCYADAAQVLDSETPVESITGLDHLEEKELVILGDGAQQPNRRVTDGAILIDPPASKVIIGLPFESVIQPMRLELQMQDGTAQGRRMIGNRVTLRLDSSGGGEAADDLDNGRWQKIDYREPSDAMDAPPPLFTGDKDLILETRHSDRIDAAVRHTEPLPFTLVAMILKVDVYGN